MDNIGNVVKIEYFVGTFTTMIRKLPNIINI
jgi:hypothetical protein